MTAIELRDKLSAKFDFEQWLGILGDMFPKVEIFTQTNQVSHSLIKSGGQVGMIRLDDGRSLAIYKFEVSDRVLIDRNRKGLRDIAAQTIDQSVIHGVLAFYYSKNVADYRLTYIAKQSTFNENGELIKSETAPKRYTFLLGPDEPCRTASDRLYELMSKKRKGSIYLADVTEAFSVERLNKDFFAGYKAQYTKFLKQLSDTKQNRDYVKKLLGRLVFLQFLQKKGWMGVPASNTNWEGGNKDYMSHLVAKYEGNARLLSDVLKVLFFNTLNKKREGDIADIRLGEHIKIPYLNGGLFEKDNIDRLNIDFPYSYFKELMDFFSMYNFTVDENDPDDSEVGIDPEMLGHIFENLLEDNKDKGAFYTPKEIVQYMCKESVLLYLKNHTENTLHSAIEILITLRRVPDILQTKENALKIYNLLKSIKICDPAIGSGAFPMGILNVLFHSRQLLYGFTRDKHSFSHAEVKREIIQENIYGVDIEQGAVDIARLRFWLALVVDEETPQPLPNLDYKIVCGDSLLSRNNLTIPILNVFAEYNKNKKGSDKITLDRYQELIRNYLDASDHDKKAEYNRLILDIKSYFKAVLRDQWRFFSKKEQMLINKYLVFLDLPSTMKNIFNETPDESKLSAKAKVELNKIRRIIDDRKKIVSSINYNKLYQNAFEWRYEFPALLDEKGNFIGFDIVIGNPPYLRIQGIRDKNPDLADELIRIYESATGAFDLYVTFVERGLQIIKKDGILNYIMPVKWTNAAFGKGLRTIVSDKYAAYKIINFGAYQVFNASTYTGLQWFIPNSHELSYYELDKNLITNQELDVYLKSLKDQKAAKIKSEKLNKEPWVLTVGTTTDILGKLEIHPRRIGDIFEKIFQGLATSKDDVYFLYECTEEDGLVRGYSKQLAHFINIERGLVKPLLKGEDVHRYNPIASNRFVIFPYKIEKGKAILYTEKELTELFPNGYAYLKECEDVLRGREKGKLKNDKYWYKYIYPKNLVLFANEKLIAPDISMGGNFAYDEKGLFYQTTTVYGYVKRKEIRESYKFWIGLLNSRLFWWYLKNTGTVLANGFFRFKPDYIKPFPVPELQQTSKGERIVERLTDFLLYLYDKNNADILTYISNKRLAIHIEEIIDMIFYELYFEQHMKDNQIDVIADLNNYDWSGISDAVAIESFYKWYQQSGNMVRQKIMLLDTRSYNFIYQIHRTATI